MHSNFPLFSICIAKRSQLDMLWKKNLTTDDIFVYFVVHKENCYPLCGGVRLLFSTLEIFKFSKVMIRDFCKWKWRLLIAVYMGAIVNSV